MDEKLKTDVDLENFIKNTFRAIHSKFVFHRYFRGVVMQILIVRNCVLKLILINRTLVSRKEKSLYFTFTCTGRKNLTYHYSTQAILKILLIIIKGKVEHVTEYTKYASSWCVKLMNGYYGVCYAASDHLSKCMMQRLFSLTEQYISHILQNRVQI